MENVFSKHGISWERRTQNRCYKVITIFISLLQQQQQQQQTDVNLRALYVITMY